MADIGFYKTTVCREVDYSGKGPPIEVEIEIQGVIRCDSGDWGLEAHDLEAKIVERELDDSEIDALGLEADLLESFSDSDPVPPKIGERYRGPDGAIWTVVTVAMEWHEASRYVLIERENPKSFFKGPSRFRRLVNTADFAHGYTDGEGDEPSRPMFEPVVDPKEYPEGHLRPMGYVDEASRVWD